MACRQGSDVPGRKSHTKVYLNGKVSTLPRHGAKEIPEGTRRAILRQLGLDED